MTRKYDSSGHLQIISWIISLYFNLTFIYFIKRILLTYLVKVAYTTSAGKVYGRLNNDNSLILLCLKSQFTSPLFAESIASWNIVRTVSGSLATNASYINKIKWMII